jgi:hypothetical protein
MELSPTPFALSSMLRGRPLPFANDRESRAVDDEMDGLVGRDEMQGNIEALATPREGGVVGSFEIDPRQRQDRP